MFLLISQSIKMFLSNFTTVKNVSTIVKSKMNWSPCEWERSSICRVEPNHPEENETNDSVQEDLKKIKFEI